MRGSEEFVIDVGALLQKVEAAAPIDAVEAVATALQNCREIGPGVVHQVCREQQRIFMNGAWPDLSRARDQSKWR